LKIYETVYLLFREREQRLAARNEALQTAAEQLQLKIKQKVKRETFESNVSPSQWPLVILT
jgi:hypothetical protein